MDQDLHQDYDELRSSQRYYADGQIQRRVQAMYRFEDPAETVFDDLLRRLDQANSPVQAAALGSMASVEKGRLTPPDARREANE